MIDGFNIPETRDEVLEKLQTDTKSNLPTSQPKLKPSFLDAMLTGISGNQFDIYSNIRKVPYFWFPQTAPLEFLIQIGNVYDVTRLSATQSKKYITFNGTLGVVISISTAFNWNGLTYLSTAESSVSLKTKTPTSVVRTGDVVRVTFSEAHNLSQNVLITMAGWTPSDFNVVGTSINVLNTTQFEYTLAGTAGGATGGNSSWTNALIEILSDNSGAQTNIPNDTSVGIETPIVNLDNSGFSTYDDVLTGEDEEDVERFRERVILAYRIAGCNFSISTVGLTAKELVFVKDVWIFPIYPEIGEASVYFTTNDGFPSSTEIQELKDHLDERVLPINTPSANLIVDAPTGVSIDITITSLTPTTQDMIDNLNSAIDDYFSNNVDVGVDFNRFAFYSYLLQTQDSLGNFPTFNLALPASDVTINIGELAEKGNVLITTL